MYISTNILVCSTIYYSAEYNLVQPAHTQPRELTGSASSIFIYTCHKTFLLYYRCINPSGTRQPQSTANVTMPIHHFAFYIRAGSARRLKQTTIRSPQPIQSILPWPPSGCPGPVPLALRGRSEGPASLAHGSVFSVFLINDAVFSTPFVFQASEGGQRGVQELSLIHI